MMNINDNDVCPTCGAYREGLWCVNGHRWDFEKKVSKEEQRKEVQKAQYKLLKHISMDIDCGNCAMGLREELFIEQEIKKIIEGCGMKLENFEVRA